MVLTMTKQEWAQVAHEMLDQGYARSPVPVVDPKFLAEVRESYRAFRKSLEEQSFRKRLWAFDAEDDGKPDLGLIVREGEDGKDVKTFFHYQPRIERYILMKRPLRTSTPEEKALLFSCSELHNRCRKLVCHLADELDATLFSGVSFSQEIHEAVERPIRYSHQTLRLLHYPAQEEGRRAGEHQDRSLITIHLGDVGGHLYTVPEKGSDKRRVISPEDGHALFFFGKKAEFLTAERISALWHGSCAEAGQEREAAVFFAHSNMALESASET